MGDSMNMFMFDLFPVIFIIMFLFIAGTIIFNAVRGVKTWSYNNAQPVLTVNAKIVTKRTNVSHNTHHHDNVAHHSTSTTYYVTFEVESGSRMEFKVASEEYGMLVEGDQGKLTFQGSRYHAFNREI